MRKAHGLRGDVVVRTDSDHPDRFAPGATFYADGDATRPLIVARTGPGSGGLIVGFEGVTDRDAADALRGVTLCIPASERRPLSADEYWADDLVGMEVADASGNVLGTVTGVEFGSAQDRLVVATTGGARVEVPFVAAIVTAVDGSRVVVDPPDGLFPR